MKCMEWYICSHESAQESEWGMLELLQADKLTIHTDLFIAYDGEHAVLPADQPSQGHVPDDQNKTHYQSISFPALYNINKHSFIQRKLLLRTSSQTSNHEMSSFNNLYTVAISSQ